MGEGFSLEVVNEKLFVGGAETVANGKLDGSIEEKGRKLMHICESENENATHTHTHNHKVVERVVA